jgi:DNA-binding winged helix-turn-helix (wHTH) protein
MRYLFDDYVLDSLRCELHQAGAPLRLRPKVFQVLTYLLAHRDRVVSKQELLDQMWPNQFVGDETLKSCITALRKALHDQGRRPRWVRTLHGQGYRFVGMVEVREHLPADDPNITLPGHRAEGRSSQVELSPSAPATPPEELEPPARIKLDGVYRHVTVLCGALIEAATLAAKLGPEAMHYVMHDVLALVQDTVESYGGTLTQISGEGFLALFGALVAQEDHARRAVLAAIELRRRLHDPAAIRGQPHGVAVGFGVHTGPVVVGPLAHEPQRLYTAAGDTIQLAIQLQQEAEPDTLLVSGVTYGLVQDEVRGAMYDLLSRPGLTTSAPVYAVHEVRHRRGGVLRRSTRVLSPFVGRRQELRLLHARLAQACGGQGQVVGIVGEPGLGKTRLLAEFVQRLRGRRVTCCEGHCLPFDRATPYLPVRDLLRELWNLHGTPPATLVATVYQRLQEAGVTSEDEGLLLLQLLELPADPEPLAGLSPAQRKARTFAMLRQIFRHASQRQPLLLMLENLHWIDPTSEAWLASLLDRLGDIAVLLLTTYRPGYQPPWITHSAATQVALPHLSRRDSLVVLQSVPQAAQLPAALQQAIIAKAAGNPFFVEELGWAATHGDAVEPLPLPDTVEAVLAARLDQLPSEAKHLVQTAAVVGPNVPVPLLQRLAGLPEDRLQHSLAHLQEREFLYELDLATEQTYTFKHTLTREVAYGSLLHKQRRDLHEHTAEAIERSMPSNWRTM